MKEPLSSNDIEEAALRCLRRFGARAAKEAWLRAEELRDCGDREAFSLWLAIHRRIEVLLATPNSLGDKASLQ